ncbi:MAG: DUF805 domain-containing protein [Rhodoglobus sp.]
MTFFESIAIVFRKYAEFTGRAGLAEFWWFVLFSFISSSIFAALDLTAAQSMFAFGANLAGAWSIALIVPQLAVTVRRLRDSGRHWANIFWILLPIAGIIVLAIYLAQPSTELSAAGDFSNTAR